LSIDKWRLRKMKIRWTQISETAWYGRRSGDRFVTEITRDGAYYFVDGCKYAYLSLRAAKIAAAKTVTKREIFC
jgi:hypothetical protein